ncbi:hypothetical protein EBX93_16405 [bacterium]|nr:hypothetical protein [bacterium]
MNKLNHGYMNVNTNHPIQNNAQEYISYKKYVSIHSEDRNIVKYPNSNEFEIQLPESLQNVVSLRLINWSFPANYNTFSVLASNVTMTFKINNPYNPNSVVFPNDLYYKIFECLFSTTNDNYTVVIEEGFYTPTQMTTELTNKFNYVVTQRIKEYFVAQGYTTELNEFILAGGYTNFVIVYNSVTQKIWFGNICDGFTLTNETQFVKSEIVTDVFCKAKQQLPDYANWGLPANLGLTRVNIESINGDNTNIDFAAIGFETVGGVITPRFFYGDVVTAGDNGYWLLPNSSFTSSVVNWVEAPYKINLMGPAYFYLDIAEQNCIDETSPYNLSEFTSSTNKTNGIVNSSFAKIPIPTTPISQWFDRDSLPYKLYYPPAERISKMKFKLRYHNGMAVDFGVFDYSFMIEFTLLVPQTLRSLYTDKYIQNNA